MPTEATQKPSAKQAAAACEEQTSRRWRTVKLVFPRARPHESDDEAAARALGARVGGHGAVCGLVLVKAHCCARRGEFGAVKCCNLQK